MYRFQDATATDAAVDSSIGCDPTTDEACTGLTVCDLVADPECVAETCDPSMTTDGSCED